MVHNESITFYLEKASPTHGWVAGFQKQTARLDLEATPQWGRAEKVHHTQKMFGLSQSEGHRS